ncbi:hypothetical protein OGCDGJMD_01234 [Cyanobium usitatum str. Tous]|nr:hypothetical protein OGCDGJMD_01234 [Cyanobium usitatum str. Tous]
MPRQPLSTGLASKLLRKGATGQRYLDTRAIGGGGGAAVDSQITQAIWDTAIEEMKAGKLAGLTGAGAGVEITYDEDGYATVSFDVEI